MGSLRAILRHPDDLYPLVKLKLAARNAEKQIPPEPHWGFCYTMLHKVSRSFGLVIQQLDTDLRDAVSGPHFCCFWLNHRAISKWNFYLLFIYSKLSNTSITIGAIVCDEINIVCNNRYWILEPWIRYCYCSRVFDVWIIDFTVSLVMILLTRILTIGFASSR